MKQYQILDLSSQATLKFSNPIKRYYKEISEELNLIKPRQSTEIRLNLFKQDGNQFRKININQSLQQIPLADTAFIEERANPVKKRPKPFIVKCKHNRSISTALNSYPQLSQSVSFYKIANPQKILKRMDSISQIGKYLL